jgi:MFS transporter, DHA3 family, macrolide efflux protein
MFPFRNRDFSLFLCAQATSNLGDATRSVLVPLLVLQLTHSPLLVAAASALAIFPNLAFQLPAGALLDRWDRRRTMLLADTGRGVLTIAVPLAALAHGPVLIVALAIQVPLGALAALFGAGFGALTPSLVGERELGRAFALTEGLESAAWIAGPGVAGALATTIGAAPGLAVDGLSYLVSALGMSLVRARPVAGPAGGSVWASVLAGLRFFWGNAALRRAQTIWTLYLVVGSGVVTGIVYIGSDAGRASPVAASAAVAAYGAGSLAGTVGAGWIRRLDRWPLLAAATAVIAVGAALIAAAAVPGLVGGGFLFGLGEGALLVVYLEVRAASTPDHMMARVSSVGGVLAGGSTAIAAAWLGAALQWLGGASTFLLTTAALTALAAWAAAGPGPEGGCQPGCQAAVGGQE